MSRFTPSRPVIRRASIVIDDALDASIASIHNPLKRLFGGRDQQSWLLNVAVREAIYAMEAQIWNGGLPLFPSRWRLQVVLDEEPRRCEIEDQFEALDDLLKSTSKS
jgi:hypothetical protein